MPFAQESTAKVACKGRHVIIVEDIVDTGHTLHCLREHVMRNGAASVAAVALLDKAARRTQEVAVEYIGFECPDEFVVGYASHRPARNLLHGQQPCHQCLVCSLHIALCSSANLQ